MPEGQSALYIPQLHYAVTLLGVTKIAPNTGIKEKEDIGDQSVLLHRSHTKVQHHNNPQSIANGILYRPLFS